MGDGYCPGGTADRSLARSAWERATPKEPSHRVQYDLRGLCAPIRRLEGGNFECSNAKQNRNDP